MISYYENNRYRLGPETKKIPLITWGKSIDVLKKGEKVKAGLKRVKQAEEFQELEEDRGLLFRRIWKAITSGKDPLRRDKRGWQE